MSAYGIEKILKIGIIRATVLVRRHRADMCNITVDMPSSMPKVDEHPLSITFTAEADTGAQYVRDHFGVEPEIIQA